MTPPERERLEGGPQVRREITVVGVIVALALLVPSALAAPVPLAQVGSSGPGAGQLAGPQDVVIDASGTIYVADASNNRISEFAADGSFVRAFGYGVDTGAAAFQVCTAATTCQAGTPGGAAGQLFTPGGLALDGSGNLFVVSSNNNRVDEFSLAGPTFTKAFGFGVNDGIGVFQSCTTGSGCLPGIAGNGAGQLNFPGGIAAGGGSVLVADRTNHRISAFDPATPAAIGSFGSFGTGPGELIFPNDVSIGAGAIFVSDGNNQRISRFTAAMSPAFVHSFGWGVMDSTSLFQVCTGSCIAGIPGGGAGQLNLPIGLDADSSGNLWAADFSNNRVDEFATGGPAFTQALGFGVDTNANAYEVCTTASGCEAGGSGSGAGQPTGAAGVAVDNCGAVWVAEQTNDRIERFGEPGTQPTPPCTLAAPVKPSNAFTLGKPKANKKKGTATISVDVPGPGQLQLSGKGVKGVSAQASAVASASTVRLTVRAKGSSNKALKRKGKIKVTAAVTFTPTGGDPNTLSKKVQLKRKRKR
jgi:NHL repeat